ncbi:M20/M25/M40 family metallo-hydrolase [Azospirillum sp. B21]|uniref:M20/M25/M40 family metallo-hydrolase n=1 Tax=Azospirillum sp. B21 TaxID=2607496 RepID=UPI0011ED74B9|nr:M20/M25/M40 family metallo-hydrolase [Azospirillum sp. B21]KAA0582184.1 M20/M25/M40 family metallo-hydrolase [Azospirillum sp. B21]
MLPVDAVLRKVDSSFEESVGRLCELLRIPSVSTDPAYAGDVRRAAQWCADRLAAMGFTVTINETPGHPILVAHHPGPGPGPQGVETPHVLYYGHYDVQPADPVELWNSPPFEPVIVEAERGRRVVARGAADDKGQTMTFMEAFEAWHAVHGSIPIRATVLLEGEEETGSPSLPRFLKEHAAELQADFCLVTDTNAWDVDTPAITTRLRGLLYLEATVTGPSHDLHSGLFGGAVPNPINVLTGILGQIHDADGRVRFDGFYDGVRELPDDLLAQIRGLPLDEAQFLGALGLTRSHGEAGRTLLERIWTRPTCDINGIWGGYTGEGSKTVIPAKASCKLSCRLVPGQDPAAVEASVQRFFEERLPADCTVSFRSFSSSPGIEVPTDTPWMQAVRGGLKEATGRDGVLIGGGGSIPIVGWFREYLGLDTILVGFGLDDDRIHSPNEKFELKCLRNGILSHAAILGRLAAGQVG